MHACLSSRRCTYTYPISFSNDSHQTPYSSLPDPRVTPAQPALPAHQQVLWGLLQKKCKGVDPLGFPALRLGATPSPLGWGCGAWVGRGWGFRPLFMGAGGGWDGFHPPFIPSLAPGASGKAKPPQSFGGRGGGGWGCWLGGFTYSRREGRGRGGSGLGRRGRRHVGSGGGGGGA